MSESLSADTRVLVVGAGIMGAGIAQVAAQAGHRVALFDLREGAAAAARDKLGQTLDGLAAKGKLTPEAVQATLARIEAIGALDEARGCGLVVEAIVEHLDAKRALFRQLENLLGPDAILATNTSSISVTAIANGLQRPERLVGMHFFNPVPLMKLVEVVSGLRTDAAVAAAIFDLSKAWGKVPVHAKSTPGFIVNRIARPYYAETLALLQEQAAPPEVLDACLRAAGFRMGPCELMDLIGHDTNFAVTNSVYAANFYDKRYVPSLVQQQLVDGGLLGRKSGRGFYAYPDGAPALPTPDLPPLPEDVQPVVHGLGELADTLATRLPMPHTRQPDSGWVGLSVGAAQLRLTDGPTAGEIAAGEGLADVAVFDCLPGRAWSGALALAFADTAGAAWRAQAPAWLALLGVQPQAVADTPGLVVARTLAMLVNEAADAVHQGVCSPEGADAAMKLGVNYPAGPFEWLAGWSARGVLGILAALDDTYRGERYRASPWLLRRAQRDLIDGDSA